MHPKRTLWERIRKKDPPFLGSIEDIFHAMKINPPDTSPYAPTGKFTYFVIFTKVGVGDYGNNIIKNIYIRFQFEKNPGKIPDMEIVSTSPNDSSRVVGTVKGTRDTTSGYVIDAGANAEAKISGMAYGSLGGGITGSITKKTNTDEIITYEYPNSIQISASSGVGNYAIWDFKQGGAAARKGQYDLQIIFKINEPITEIRQGQESYHINWKVAINGRELMDDEGREPQPRPVNLII